MLSGHILDERYQIKEMIGGGGMANVYLAHDLILDRDVAIKMLRLEFADDQEFIARFDREAQAATSLSHPNIVNIYDVGEEDNLLYMVMEYVKGMTLKEYIQRFGPIAVPEAIDIMKQITSAITHAHENNIVHRDIKPQNILIDPSGQVKVTDFGIAIALSATALTQTNSILGSVHYLSPEQARGGMATKKSDIYSLGIVFYELLTGRLPFSGQSPVSIALKHLQSETPSVKQFNPSIPQSVENIVLQATTKDPFHRFATVYEMEKSLEVALNPDKVNEKKFSPPIEVGEETKAIPIITSTAEHDMTEDTILHNRDEETIKVKEENEKPLPKNKKNNKQKRKRKWLRMLVIIFILLASGIAALFIVPSLLKPKDVKIPDIIEMPYDEAVLELEKIKLKAEKELTYSDEIEEGLVVKTDPRVGRTVKENSTITVFVSEGKEKEKFDDYVGQDFEQVKSLLEDQGFEDVIAYKEHSDRPEGEILNQIQPEPGKEVVPSETTVIFEVSSGPELISLNNLKGMTESEVKNYLEANGLHLNAMEENSDSVPIGEVIKQRPESGTQLKKGDSVDVYFSIGPKEQPPVSRTVTFTVPYHPEANDQDGEHKEQIVRIYMNDMEHHISEVYKEDKIKKDTEYTITLTIAPDSYGEYKVLRDDELIIDKTVSYKDGE